MTTTTTKFNAETIRLVNASMLPENINNFLNRSDLLISLRYDKIFIFKGKDSAFHAAKRSEISDENLKKRKYTGNLSPSAAKFISNQLHLWHSSISAYNSHHHFSLSQRKHQLIFVTLTLPFTQKHTDQQIKREILVPFIDKLKYHVDIQHYFWRAEKQVNGNIHFHCIFDKYIPADKLRKLWNDTCEKLGYISAFQAKHGHRCPPSTDVRVIDNGKYTFKYILKYATKNEGNIPVSGKIWGMSDSIRNLRQFTINFSQSCLNTVLHDILKPNSSLYFSEHFLSIPASKPLYRLINTSFLMKQFFVHILRIYHYLYFSDLHPDTDLEDTLLTDLTYEELLQISKKP